MEQLQKEISKIKAGNYLKYTGPLYKHRDHIGRVNGVDELNGDGECYRLQIYDYNGQPSEEIRAYEDGVRDITLREDHLLNAGFTKDANASVYHYRNLTVFYFTAIRPQKQGELTLELPDYWATTEYNGIPKNIDELDTLKERSVYVGRLHLFQNLMAHFFQTNDIQY